KFTTTLMTTACISLFVLSSFKNKSEKNQPGPFRNIQPEENPAIIVDRAEARALYENFSRKYPEIDFAERGGFIGKSTIEALLSRMSNPADTMVYYYFGRTNDAKNLIMLFNNPDFNNLDDTPKFRTVTPYC